MISPRARLAGMLGVAALAVGGAGCGGGGSGRADAANVKRTVQRALAALANGNGPGFCALATAGARSELAGTTPGASCRQVVTRISRQLGPAVKLGLQNARVGAVTLDGNRASIRAGEITSAKGTLRGFLQASAPPTRLTRQPDGTWKIAR